MLGFSDEERFNAFSSACVSATGMLSVLDDGSELKPYNVAKTALLALTSLELAKAGFRGNPDPLGGYRGYFKMMTGYTDIKLKPLLLNGTYAIRKSYTKPYASCRYTHPSVEAAIYLRNEVNVKSIERIDIQTYDLAVTGHDHIDIQGSYSAKMSIPYATAAGLIYGKAGLQEFSEEIIEGTEIQNLTRKIHVSASDELSEAFPNIQAAILTIKTNDEEYIARIDFPKGEPENPLTDKEFKDRYEGLMEYADIDSEISAAVFDIVYKKGALVNDLVRDL